MTQRIDIDLPEQMLAKLDELQDVSRLALRVGDNPLFEASDQGYLTHGQNAEGDDIKLFDSIKGWLRPRCIELEVEICGLLSEMYLDILDVTGDSGTPSDLLMSAVLDLNSERQTIAGRLVQLRELLSELAKVHRNTRNIGSATPSACIPETP